MSVQVMNTQLQLQQSLQQLIAMGTQSNQSELTVPAVNQSQLMLSANQQHRGVIVNNQHENLQVFFLVIFLVVKHSEPRKYLQKKLLNLFNDYKFEVHVYTLCKFCGYHSKSDMPE